MTVSNQTSTETYNGNGVTTVWDLPFRFFENTDIFVYLVDPVAQVTTPLVLGTDYTLTGAGVPEQFGTAPGKITTTVAVPSGRQLLVKRIMELEQLTDIVNQGRFFPEVHEDVFDRLTMFIQQNAAGIANSIQLDGSGNFWDFRGHRGINAADPINAQDVATRGWVGSFLSTIQGPVNNAANIFMMGADGNAHVVQDLSAAIGAYMVGYKARSVGRRLEEKPSLGDYAGIVPDSLVVDNLAQVNAAIAAGIGGKVWLPPGIYRTSTFPTNNRGVEYEGPGGVAVPALGGLRQISKYADKHKYAIGHEYLYKVYKRLEINGVVNIHLHGDSTMAGGNGESPEFSTTSLVRSILANKGISNVNVVNYAVGGTKFSDVLAQLHIDTTVANTTDLLIIKDGINDMGTGSPTRIEDMITALRNLLNTIRNSITNGSLDKLSIIIMGPNATNDIPNGRDEKAYEQLRGLMVQAARDFQCCYIDPYAYLNDCWGLAGNAMDSPFPTNPIIAIHPLNTMQSWIWGFVMNYAFGQDETRAYAKNNFQNSGAIAGTVPFATLATNFNYGLSIYRCTDGPVNGQLVTFRHADGGAWQTLFGFGASPKKVERTWNIGANAWTGGSGSITTATLLNGWVTFGAPRATPGFYRDGNRGYACGSIKSGTVTAGTNLFVIPPELRPAADHICLNRGAGGGVGIGVNAAGNVFLQSAGDATETCLDNLSWPIA